ncbi:MAG: PorP/SprF family type IX secretion system membrane protein [Bacteroidetes bacterium]|nr:PorP/SprF family type IX secretion system membrane protein [Bacteroidota bacterium]MCB9226456.1 PorP/SprF family type IX secretion system membrane protein [Chitinophagales bacterium]
MKKLFTFSFILLSFSLIAQQLPDFSLFRENAFLYNPAVAGTEQASVINLSARKQWTNIKRSPLTVTASFHTSLPNKNIGLGAIIFNDFIGPTNYTGLTGSFAYNLVLSRDLRGVSHYKVLSFGLAASIVQYRINGNQIDLDQPNDNAILNGKSSQFFPDAAFGVYYKSRTLFASVSIPQLLHLNVPFKGDNGQKTKFKKMQHYYAMFGGRIFFGKDKVTQESKDKFYLEPAFNFHYVIGSIPQAMISARFAMKDVFFVGLGYRSIQNMMMEGGFTIKKQFSIFYSYDMAFGSVRKDAGQVHEVGLKYKFNKNLGSF